jgi:hypothetical protein
VARIVIRWSPSVIVLSSAAVLVAALLLTVMMRFGVDSDEPEPIQTGDREILRPYTEMELQTIILPGTSRKQLLAIFGAPFDAQTGTNRTEVMEFWISDQKRKPPVKYVLSSFRVVLSNDVVIGWKPLAHRSIGQP